MSERSLKDKVVVITGGATGIGHEIAKNYVERGAKVILLDLDNHNGEEAIKKLNKISPNKAIFMQCDVTSDLDKIAEEIFKNYHVDVLVNNAGILNDAQWKKCIDINVTYLIGWSLKFWEYMRKDLGGRGGTIINLASIYGFRVEPYIPVYQASKFAVMGFTKSLGHEFNYEKSGVRVIAICPGFTETKLTDIAKSYDDEFFGDTFKKYLEQQRWQKPEDVGAAAVDVYERAKSGTAWLIEGGDPVKQVP